MYQRMKHHWVWWTYGLISLSQSMKILYLQVLYLHNCFYTAIFMGHCESYRKMKFILLYNAQCAVFNNWKMPFVNDKKDKTEDVLHNCVIKVTMVYHCIHIVQIVSGRTWPSVVLTLLILFILFIRIDVIDLFLYK